MLCSSVIPDATKERYARYEEQIAALEHQVFYGDTHKDKEIEALKQRMLTYLDQIQHKHDQEKGKEKEKSQPTVVVPSIIAASLPEPQSAKREVTVKQEEADSASGPAFDAAALTPLTSVLTDAASVLTTTRAELLDAIERCHHQSNHLTTLQSQLITQLTDERELAAAAKATESDTERREGQKQNESVSAATTAIQEQLSYVNTSLTQLRQLIEALTQQIEKMGSITATTTNASPVRNSLRDKLSRAPITHTHTEGKEENDDLGTSSVSTSRVASIPTTASLTSSSTSSPSQSETRVIASQVQQIWFMGQLHMQNTKTHAHTHRHTHLHERIPCDFHVPA